MLKKCQGVDSLLAQAIFSHEQPDVLSKINFQVNQVRDLYYQLEGNVKEPTLLFEKSRGRM